MPFIRRSLLDECEQIMKYRLQNAQKQLHANRAQIKQLAMNQQWLKGEIAECSRFMNEFRTRKEKK